MLKHFADGYEQFIDDFVLAVADLFYQAPANMVFENKLANRSKGSLRSGNLMENIVTICIPFEHSFDAAYLAFDSVKP